MRAFSADRVIFPIDIRYQNIFAAEHNPFHFPVRDFTGFSDFDKTHSLPPWFS
jgi:hypothetical protein